MTDVSPPSDVLHAAKEILSSLSRLPSVWDGRAAVQEMKDEGSQNWRQMEWPGFYFEHLCAKNLQGVCQIPGLAYGRIRFDAFLEIPWDFKCHASNTSRHEIIVNDREAIELAILNFGFIGLVLAIGEVTYNDENRTFQAWHETLKGGQSKYTQQRIERGAWSRLRKTSVRLRQIGALVLDSQALITAGSFQTGFRNADGSKRRAKVLLDLEKSHSHIVETVEFE